MDNINEMVESLISRGFTLAQARNKIAQEIILSKIEKSNYVDHVLLKGGIVMYNISKEQRRTTTDIDLDFIRFDISKEQNIKKFVDVLNKRDAQYQITIKSIKELHQDDYKGKKLVLIINDDHGSNPITFSMDLGVHTLLGIEQDKMCFVYEDGKQLSLWVNPPEQIVAEKLYSLAKIGPDSTRYKDIDDIYYLINNTQLDVELLRRCLSTMVIGNRRGFKDVYDIIDKVDDCLNNTLFIDGFKANNSLWLDVDYKTLKDKITNFIYKI